MAATIQVPTLPAADLGLLKVARASWPEALEFTRRLVESGERHFVCFCEANLLSSVITEPTLGCTLNSAAAIFPDGVALMMLARIRRSPLPERIPGPAFMLAAAEYGLRHGWRHFFCGGAPGVAERLAASLQQKLPGLLVAGTHSPPFRELSPAEEAALEQQIEKARPHLFWLALGSPKQEKWAAARVGKLPVPLILPVGAAFDFHSGARPWAPEPIRRAGLEWCFRALTGGPRLLRRNTRCVSIVMFHLLRTALCQNRSPRR